MEEDLDKTEKEQEQQPIRTPLEKPKKERSEKQKQATEKMLLAKKQREDDLRTLRIEREMKEKEQAEKLKEKIQKKIVEKAIKITKKKPVPSKKDLLALLSDDDDDDEDTNIKIETPILKKRVPVKGAELPDGRPPLAVLKQPTDKVSKATLNPLIIKFI